MKLGIFVLFLILEEKLSVFYYWILAVGFSYMAFIMLSYFLSTPSLLRFFFFIMKGCRFLSDTFSASSEIIMWHLSFILLMWCIPLINYPMLNHLWIPGTNPTWSRCVILLMCCVLLRIFASVFITDTGLWFSCQKKKIYLCLVLVSG